MSTLRIWVAALARVRAARVLANAATQIGSPRSGERGYPNRLPTLARVRGARVLANAATQIGGATEH